MKIVKNPSDLAKLRNSGIDAAVAAIAERELATILDNCGKRGDVYDPDRHGFVVIAEPEDAPYLYPEVLPGVGGLERACLNLIESMEAAWAVAVMPERGPSLTFVLPKDLPDLPATVREYLDAMVLHRLDLVGIYVENVHHFKAAVIYAETRRIASRLAGALDDLAKQFRKIQLYPHMRSWSFIFTAMTLDGEPAAGGVVFREDPALSGLWEIELSPTEKGEGS